MRRVENCPNLFKRRFQHPYLPGDSQNGWRVDDRLLLSVRPDNFSGTITRKAASPPSCDIRHSSSCACCDSLHLWQMTSPSSQRWIFHLRFPCYRSVEDTTKMTISLLEISEGKEGLVKVTKAIIEERRASRERHIYDNHPLDDMESWVDSFLDDIKLAFFNTKLVLAPIDEICLSRFPFSATCSRFKTQPPSRLILFASLALPSSWTATSSTYCGCHLTLPQSLTTCKWCGLGKSHPRCCNQCRITGACPPFIRELGTTVTHSTHIATHPRSY